MFHTISTGVSGTEMAGYAARLSPDDIWRIVAFLHFANPGASVAGDSARGEAVFWGEGGCGNCHAVNNRGSLVGPDLSRIGRSRTAAYLKESLLAPSGDIARGFDGISVVLRDGSTLRGLERALDDFSVVLQDFSGKVYSFDRSDVRSVTRDKQSLMPEFGAALSPAELNDLLAYLAGLGGSHNREVR
jgi:putative heme-binding domain-containing protein